MTGFEKIQQQITAKNSHLVLGLDPTPDMDSEIRRGGGLEAYLKSLIDQTQEHVVGIKPNLAFYESIPTGREVLARVMGYAARKYALPLILDVKRGDIMDTQGAWASADTFNFHPDVVTLNPYMGGADVIKPFLDYDSDLCAFVLTRTSNPGADEIQEGTTGGLRIYQDMALKARQWDPERVGYVVGATKPDAMRNIRAVEAEMGLPPAMVLAPGFGKQGGNLEFVRQAGEQSIYPISSGLTKPKYLAGYSSGDAAEQWRDDINRELGNSEDIPTITQQVIDNMIKEGLIIVPASHEVETWPFLKKGREKLKAAGITLAEDDTSRTGQLRELLNAGVIDKSDFTTVYMDIRNVSKSPGTQRLLAFLYKQMIIDSQVEFDRIGSVPYGATTTAALVAEYLGKPSLMLRKERGIEATHDDVVGSINDGDKVAMIEDVTTSASSLVSDINELRAKYGAQISDAFVFVKRTPEGEERCRQNDINLHYLIDMVQLRQLIANSSIVSDDVREIVLGQG